VTGYQGGSEREARVDQDNQPPCEPEGSVRDDGRRNAPPPAFRVRWMESGYDRNTFGAYPRIT
jgi:hypothetical protein